MGHRIVLLAVFVGVLACPPCQAIPLLTNGGFETGDLTSWSVTDFEGEGGSFFVLGDEDWLPVSSGPGIGAATGGFYAVSDQGGRGVHALSQNFTVTTGYRVFLTFSMSVDDQSGSGGAGTNQEAFVGILSATESPLNIVGPGVLVNLYRGVDSDNPPDYIPYLFDITPFVAQGGTFQIRFGEVDNLDNLHLAVDDVSIEAVAIPEPSTILLLFTGLVAMASLRQRRG